MGVSTGGDFTCERQEGRREPYHVEETLFRVWERESWQYSGLRVKLGLQGYGFGKLLGEYIETNWLQFYVKIIDCTINLMSTQGCGKGMGW